MRTAPALVLTLLVAACQSSTQPTGPVGPNLSVLPGGGGGYRIRDLGTPADAFSSRASAVNDRGQIVGDAYYQSFGGAVETSDALLWDRRGRTVIGRLPGNHWGVAEAINDRGQVAGQSLSASQLNALPDAWIWYHGTMADLDPSGGTPYRESHAWDINGRGQIVGWLIDYTEPARHTFLWQRGRMRYLDLEDVVAISDGGEILGSDGTGAVLLRDGTSVELGTAPDGSPLSPIDLNNVGQVLVRGGGHTYVWKDGALTPLGIQGRAINDRGQVVGTGTGSGGGLHAFLWSGGTGTDLGTLPNGSNSGATDINDRGVVVGWSDVPGRPGGIAVEWLPLRRRNGAR